MTTQTMSWERIHGRAEPPAPTRALRAGGVEALLDGIDLRYVGRGDVEAVRRIYVAVRDHNWNTLPGVVSDLSVRDTDGGFEVSFSCRHARGDVDFAWDGSIVGEPDGSITYRMDGRANAEFDYNRIGFCVLHPFRESIGARYEGRTPSGPVSGTLPDQIEPQRFADGRYVALFDAVDRLAVELPDGGRVNFAFEGDLFETEDQRNWTDASLKTYCSPLRLGYPKRARPGDTIEQVVRVTLDPGPAEPAERPRAAVLRLGGVVRRGLAEIGLGAATHDEPLSDRQRDLIGALSPAHLRVDVHLAAPDHREILSRAIEAAASTGASLELAVFMVADDAAALEDVASLVRDRPLARVLVYAADAVSPGPHETTPPALVELVRGALGRDDVPVGGGSDMYFCELNRSRPDAGALDVVAWTVNPQVHAFDELSVIETLEAQPETLRTARAFAPGVPLAVSPVTLKPRFNANATRPEGGPASGELPTPVDPRQASLFAAAWTVGSVKRLVEGGAASVTYFEPTGWRGVVESESGPPLPQRFPSTPGMVFPVYHVLADLAGRRDDDVLAVEAADDLVVTGLALRGPDGLRVLAANLTSEPVQAAVTGLPGTAASMRVLDPSSAGRAADDPAAFRRDVRRVAIEDGALRVELGPYAVATVDLSESGATA
jgi:hypothetical protein